MAAPMWQYITILVLFSLSAALNIISIGLLAFLEKVKPDALTIPKRDLGIGSLLFKTLAALFGAYLSWSLYQFAPGALSLGIIIVHWSSLVVGYILSIKEAGNVKTYGYGQHIFGTVYSCGMLAALVTYGVQCL